MSSIAEENKILIRRWLDEVLSQGNLRRVDELFAPNYMLHDPSVLQEVHGCEGIKRYVSAYRAACPDARFVVEDQMAERDMVVTRWAARGTHRGELLGIPPTGSWVTITGIEFDRIVGDKIDETWVSYHLSTDNVLDPERVKRALAVMGRAFPDLHMAQADSVIEGNKIAFRWMMSGTHEGEFLGVAPTRELVTVMGMDIIRTVDGEIVEYWGEFDVLGMLRQIGVTP
ncbi:MAG: ester cyclase [Actinobacteria bacterium]|nr:ester cyclase [Actinomycetota bacterium]MCA1738217.1 ester cyclase [Actinomycetota bacterium]